MCNFSVTHDGVHCTARVAQASSCLVDLDLVSQTHFRKMAASASHPKPSAAPTAPMPTSPPVAVYSPVVTPEAQVVESSSSEESGSAACSDGSEYSGHTILAQMETIANSTELSPADSAACWAACDDAETHRLLCPTWQDMLRRHSCIHEGSLLPSAERDGKQMRWFHSTMGTTSSMLSKNQAGSRFVFSSPESCGLHRIFHSHFELANASVDAGFLVIGCFVHSEWLEEEAHSCQNGYSCSEAVNNISATQSGMSVVSLVSVSASIAAEVKSEATASLTRRSISHYDSLYEMSEVNGLRMVSVEMMSAIFTTTQNSNKVRSTIRCQAPELWEQLEDLMKMMDDEKKSEMGNSSSSTTNVQINMQPRDEIVIKRCKRS
eukprot:3857052-Amphidinium_carterae.1